MKEPNDLTEWNLAGLTPEQGMAKWAGTFGGVPGGSRLRVRTQWGWLAWEAGDAETAHLARIARRIPPPVLVEIAVRDPDTGSTKLFRTIDPVTVTAWSALAGLIGGGVAGCWWWGPQLPAVLLATAAAGGSAALAALSMRASAAQKRKIKVLCETDSHVTEVIAGAKILTWVTDQLLIHDIPSQQRPKTTQSAELPPELTESVDQLHSALWALATGRPGDTKATLAEMRTFAGLVVRLIQAHESVRRASTVRVAPVAPPPRAKDPTAGRLREAGRRLNDVITGQRHAAEVLNDINRRIDQPG